MRFIAVLLLIMALSGMAFAIGGSVPTCMNIPSSGVWSLTTNLNGNPIVSNEVATGVMTCIYISHSDVILDCGGHTLTGDGTNNSIGIATNSTFTAPLSNITVMNCPSISNYSVGVEYTYTSNGTITNDTAKNNLQPVTTLEQGGFVLFLSNYDNLSGNLAFNDTDGFVLDASSNNTLTNNNATYNEFPGFNLFSDSNSNKISNNIAYNDSYGFQLIDNSDFNALASNTAYNNTNGFNLDIDANSNTFTGNTADNNSNSGFDLIASSMNLLINNNATINTQNGFHLENNANGNNLTGDLALDNLGTGFFLDHVSYDSLSKDNASGNMGDGYFILSTVTSYNNITGSTAFNNYNGFELQDEDHALLASDNAYNNSNDGYYLHSVNSASSYNSLFNDNASFNGNNGFELNIAMNNLLAQDNAVGNSIDGFLIAGRPPASSNNITNSNASFSIVGFEINNDDHDYLARNLGFDNQLAGFEVDNGSTYNTLVENTAYNDSNNCYTFTGGFVIDSSQSNTLINSTSHDNRNTLNCFAFIDIPPGNGFVITNEEYIYGSSGMPADHNNLTNALAHDNSFAGVYEAQFHPATDNNYTNVQSYDNPYGFYLSGDDSDFLTNVTAFNNDVAGFYERGINGGNNNANINNSWFYNNPWEIIQQSTNDLEFVVNNTRLGQTPYITFFLDDFVSGNYTNAGYEIKETTVPGALPSGMTSFGGKYLKVNFTGESSIDEIGFIWSQAEASADDMTNNSLMGVYTWNDSGWVFTTPSEQYIDLSNSSRYTITLGSFEAENLVNITSDDVYALLYNGTVAAPPSTGGQPPVNNGYLVMSKQAVCPGNLLNVTVSTSGNGPAAGASVTVYENGNSVASGSTGPDGSVLLTMPNNDSYTVNATYGSYPAIGQGFSYVLCSGGPECTTDDNCPVDQRCQVNDNPSLNKCVPVQCQCGQSVQNHTCVGQVYQCGSGQNCNACPSGEICGDNHQCKPGCTSDGQCKDNEACKTATGAPGTTTTPGACQPLCPGGSSSCSCGQATNHTLVPYGYECGSEPGCQQCQPGYTCNSDHKCVQGDINCPPTAVVGDQKNCNVTQNNQPLSNCSVTVTDPSGKTYTESCDPSGNLQTPPLTIQGVWTVTLLQNGTAVKTVQINALPKSAPAEQPTPTAAPGFDLGSLVWLLVLLVIIIAAILYWRSRGSRRS